MKTLSLSTTTQSYSQESTFRGASLTTQIAAWCEAQEGSRLLWAGTTMALHGAVFTPIAMFLILLSGINMVLVAGASLSIMLTLIVNLAAQPMRFSIPVYAVSLAINLAVIFAAVSNLIF